jgi:hypothetical protein
MRYASKISLIFFAIMRDAKPGFKRYNFSIKVTSRPTRTWRASAFIALTIISAALVG